MYHRIGDASFDPWGLAVEEQRFEAQLNWLSRNREILPLGEFAKQHRERRLRNKAVAITFDDGYASVLRQAVPLLAKYRSTATLFLPAQLIDRRQAFWWDELAEMVFSWSGKTLRLGASHLPVPEAELHDRVWAPDDPPKTPRQQLFHSLWSRLKPLRPAELNTAMARLRDQHARAAEPSDLPATPQELRTAPAGVLEFGSHALTHSSLPALSTKAKEKEIRLSRQQCRDLTGTDPTTFAYPYGDYDAESVRLVEDAGFACAVTAEAAFVTRRNEPFVLPRIAMGNWDAAGLRRALRGG